MWRPFIRTPIASGALLCPILFLDAALGAANGLNEPLTLRPPRNEIPPSFWEQHGTLLISLGIVAALGLAFLIWYLAQPKRVVELPPEIRARRDLEALVGKPVDLEVLSRASQILKRYYGEAFSLPREEMTTAEFCRAVSAKTEIGSEVSGEICRFLKKSDALKFAPGPTPQDFPNEAMKLVEMAEQRKAALRTASSASPGKTAS